MTEEQVLIGMLLSKPEYVNLISSKIKPFFFDDNRCSVIYGELLNGNTNSLMASKKAGLSVKELTEWQSCQLMVTKELIDSYGYYVFEQHKKNEVKKLLEKEPIDIDAIEQIQKQVYFEINEVNESEEYLKNVEDRFNGLEDLRNIKTGFCGIDQLIDGFRKTEAIFVGARPGTGKTSWGINVAYQMAKNKKNVLFCSLEMGRIELHERLVKYITGISNYKTMSIDDFNQIVKISKAIKDRLPVCIFDKAGMTIEDIVFKCKEQRDAGKLDVLIIDHLAILRTCKNFRSRYEEVSFLSARIKQIAREYDIPVICLCQLNRALESRQIKAPTMADIRDSGTVEQDGDLICFLYRPEYHLAQCEPDDGNDVEHQKWEAELNSAKGKAEFIVAKNRRGQTGKVKLGFNGETYSFYGLDR